MIKFAPAMGQRHSEWSIHLKIITTHIATEYG